MTDQSIAELKTDLTPLPKNHKRIGFLNGIIYSEMIRIVSFYATNKYQSPIHIETSRISQPLGTIDFFVDIDMSKVIETSDPTIKSRRNKGLDLKFQCSKEDIKMLNSIKHADAVAILFDQDQKTYIFTDGKSVIELGQSEYDELPSPPELSGKSVGQSISEIPDRIKIYKSTVKTVTLELFHDQLENIIFNGSVKYSVSQGNALAFRKKKSEVRLCSRHFLEIIGKDKVKLTIAKDDDEYWLITETNLSLNIAAKTYERLY